MKVAVVHDQLREFGGAERVLVSLLKLFPQADIFTSTFDWNSLGEHKEYINPRKVHTSWFGKIPLINRYYSPLRFLTPLIWEKLNLAHYDLVISSTGSWMCKGVLTNKHSVHISYIHHPPRYLYGYETAIEWQKHLPIRIYGLIVNHFLRMWDFKASQRPDYLVANSIETKRRISKFYRRDSTVIYPPVTVPTTEPDYTQSGDFFLTVSRLARAKHIDVLINTANQYGMKVCVVGVGRDQTYLKSLAGPNVTFMGNVTDEKLQQLYRQARAFLFASVDEEFGIAPVEAMSHGLPVIALRSGGLKETVKDGVNGFLFDELSPTSVEGALKKLNALSESDYAKMRKNAREESLRYREEVFLSHMKDFVDRCLAEKKVSV